MGKVRASRDLGQRSLGERPGKIGDPSSHLSLQRTLVSWQFSLKILQDRAKWPIFEMTNYLIRDVFFLRSSIIEQHLLCHFLNRDFTEIHIQAKYHTIFSLVALSRQTDANMSGTGMRLSDLRACMVCSIVQRFSVSLSLNY